MTREQVVDDIIRSYNGTLSADPELADAGIDGFMEWAWSDDEPIRVYNITRDEYRDCLIDAYRVVHS